ncbi:alpha-(1-_6)-mannopyranosyltransferase A [Rhodococcus sp. NPDC003318]|uniref:alpha-(1->6)-mannopyranosyltransferase A n=1 Tax=Rhodococcus sp. NPDC003318 TaxID=3364503 RepID=UPI003698DADA
MPSATPANPEHPSESRWRTTRAFLRSDAGHAAVLGTLGAVLITFGGFGSGAVRRRDPLLEAMYLSWLRFGHGFVLSTLIVWIGVLMMIAAWVRIGRNARAQLIEVGELRWVIAAWTVPLLAAVPMFSRDAYSYLAQGALLRDGFDPYAVGPVVNPGILLDNVSNVWTTTTAPYGPVSLLIGQGITAVTGDNVIAGTMLMRIAMLPGLALMMWALPRLARQLGGDPRIALWLAVLNPLVLIHLVGGVHNELLMVGLMVAGLTLALDRKHLAGIAVISLGVAVKAMAAVALPFVIWIWMIHENERAQRSAQSSAPRPRRSQLTLFARTAGTGAAVFVAMFAACSLVAGVGLGWLTALQGSAKIINWLSVPTILAHIVTVTTSWFTGLRLGPVLEVTRAICALVMIGALAVVWWRFRRTPRQAVLGILVALVVIVALSPAALPWYYSWPLAIAAGFAMSTTTLMILVGLSTWLMLVFNPDGSIGLYSLPHVLLATFAAVVAARSLVTVDPLRLRSVRTDTAKTQADATSLATAPD